MEGRIEKHTMSSGQDIEKEKHTHTHFYKDFKGVQILWNPHRKHCHHAVCSVIPRCSVHCQALPYIIYCQDQYKFFYGRQSK